MSSWAQARPGPMADARGMDLEPDGDPELSMMGGLALGLALAAAGAALLAACWYLFVAMGQLVAALLA